ncbi:TrkH family potassium uptake protein [Actinorugispora endophytica]|uniref:Trk-type K+ transport system membrane component n=1 Tax=Actinorugispora endophytica TaxID=1605990 RepID=A0A4R6UZR9_9ACTN|nr:potassium transporter TrkG [Actinorugispora endophytica]TDQ49224.1 Trk-type K+ transport system membrane component [Actinorugispora endophytica]
MWERLLGVRSWIARLSRRAPGTAGEALRTSKMLWNKPARLLVLLFAASVTIGTGLLMLPVAHQAPDVTLVEALFTATTALCVAGLSVVDLGAHWSVFGEVVVLALIQVGGIGIMTLASVLGIVVIRRFGLRMQLTVQSEQRTLNIGDARGIVLRILAASLICEAVLTALLVPRMWLGHGMGIGEALYSGVFHAVSAFNNAGLSLYGDSLTRFSGDPLILLPIALATILGGFGFPVLLELRRHLRTPRRWALHTKITVLTSLLLFLGGAIAVTAMEWSNPETLGLLPWPQRLLDGVFHGIMPRSGGFNVVDVGAMESHTLFVTIMLMFVGGGSAGTAGGIKTATFAVICLVVWAEVRGHPHVHAFGRRLSSGAIRQALSLTFLSMTVVVFGTIYLLIATPYSLQEVLFEVTSASGVVGLSTGITPSLPAHCQVLLAVLMFAGRIGPITFASALALRERTRRYDLPEGRPIIG